MNTLMAAPTVSEREYIHNLQYEFSQYALAFPGLILTFDQWIAFTPQERTEALEYARQAEILRRRRLFKQQWGEAKRKRQFRARRKSHE